MTGDDRLDALVENLEMQAAGLYLDDRDREVEALAEAAYAEVALGDRVLASAGRRLRLTLVDGPAIVGALGRSGAGWLLVGAGAEAWLVPVAAVVCVEGLAPGSVPPAAQPRTSRLSVGSVLRRLAQEGLPCAFRLRGERLVHGVPLRVGADFLAVRSGSADLDVPLGALVAVRSCG